MNQNNYFALILILSILIILVIILLKKRNLKNFKTEEEKKIQFENDMYYANKIIHQEQQETLKNRQNALNEIRARGNINSKPIDFSNGKRQDLLSDAFIAAIVLNNISNSDEKECSRSNDDYDSSDNNCSSSDIHD